MYLKRKIEEINFDLVGENILLDRLFEKQNLILGPEGVAKLERIIFVVAVGPDCTIAKVGDVILEDPMIMSNMSRGVKDPISGKEYLAVHEQVILAKVNKIGVEYLEKKCTVGYMELTNKLKTQATIMSASGKA